MPYNLEPLPNAVLRTAALPISSLGLDDRNLATGDAETLVRYLDQAYQDAHVSIAIEHAAPTLREEATKIIAEPGKYNFSKIQRAALATNKYVNRLTTRPTPFGFFSGVSWLSFDAGGSLTVNVDRPALSADVDFKWLLPIVEKLEVAPDVLPRLRVTANDLMRKQGGRYIVFKSDTAGLTNERIAIRQNALLDHVVSETTGSWVHAQHIIDQVCGQVQEPKDRAHRFLTKLVNLTVLQTDLRPSLEGSNPLDELISKLKSIPSRSQLVEQLQLIALHLGDLEREVPRSAQTAYTETVSMMRKVQNADAYVHVQMNSGISVSLPSHVMDDAARAMLLMQKLSSNRLGMRVLRKYHDEFLERYGVDETVPVKTLVSPTEGLGVPDDYKWPKYAHGPSANPDQGILERREQHIARLYARSLQDQNNEIDLTDSDVEALSYEAFDTLHVQDSAELYLTLAANSAEDIEQRNYLLAFGANPGSHAAGSTSGRFLNLLPEAAREQFVEPVRAPTEVSAVVMYPPRSAAATNLVNVPNFGERVIRVNVPASSKAHSDEELSITDIGIRGSMEGLYAVDMRSGRRIRIRTHNTVYPPAQAPNEVRLLIELMHESQRLWEPWTWGTMDLAPVKPRVRYGRIVVSSRTWLLDELRVVGKSTERDHRDLLQRWRATWMPPRYCLAVSRDMRLLIDLDNDGHVTLLLRELVRDAGLVLQELPGGGATPDDVWGWLRREGKSHASEIVFNFHRKTSGLPSGASTNGKFNKAPPHSRSVAPPAATHLPGGEWVSCKVYIPSEETWNFIGTVVHPLFAGLQSDNPDFRGFFVRYADSLGPHLRVRVWAPDDSQQTEVVEAMRESVARKLASTFHLNEYVPEAGRYGGQQMLDVTHETFTHDSLLASEMAAGTPRQGDERFQMFTLRTLAAMLVGFGAGYDGNGESYEKLGSRWAGTLGFQPSRDRNYQANRDHWTAVVRQHIDECRENRVSQPDQAHHDAFIRLGGQLRSGVSDGSATSSAIRVIGSHMHMTVNRRIGPDRQGESRLLDIMRSVFQKLEGQADHSHHNQRDPTR